MDKRLPVLTTLLHKPMQDHRKKPILNLSTPIPVEAPVRFGVNAPRYDRLFYVVSKRGFQ